MRDTKDKKFLVYKHTSPSNKVYIGITSRNAEKRWNGGSGYTNNPYFIYAIKKYGWDNFKHEVLFENLSKEEACEKEKELIAKYGSNKRNKGYNITAGGEANSASEEGRKRISIANKGKKVSDETRTKISKARKGHSMSDESRQKLRNTRKSMNIHMSEEHKKKIIEANTGKDMSQETRSKISQGLQGKAKTLLHRKNLSEARRGKFTGGDNPIAEAIICIETGKIYECMSDADRELEVSMGSVSKCIAGKQKTVKGYHFKKIDED